MNAIRDEDGDTVLENAPNLIPENLPEPVSSKRNILQRRKKQNLTVH